MPSITFSASAAAPLYCGLKPVFVDIEENSLTMNYNDLKKNMIKIVLPLSQSISEVIRVPWTR